MFFILFRNVVYLLSGGTNFLAAFFILGIIGLMEIPLDMMTIQLLQLPGYCCR